MVCFFEVIKWMDIDRRLKKQKQYLILCIQVEALHILTDLSGPAAHSWLSHPLSSESILLCCWSWWWAYPGRCVCCTEPPLYATRCRCPLLGWVLGLCMFVSAGSAHHRTAPYTVTMMTSKTRHLLLNRPDTQIHDTHKYRTIRQAGKHKQRDMWISRHTYSANRMQQTSRQTKTSKIKHNRGRNQKQLQCWQTTFAMRCSGDAGTVEKSHVWFHCSAGFISFLQHCPHLYLTIRVLPPWLHLSTISVTLLAFLLLTEALKSSVDVSSAWWDGERGEGMEQGKWLYLPAVQNSISSSGLKRHGHERL